MRAYYCDQFVLPLPEGHRFPMSKYFRLRSRAVAEGVLRPEQMFVPDPASDNQLLTIHTPHYLHCVVNGTLDAAAQRRIGFPWSPALVERSRRSVGGTIAACRAALVDGVAVNLAGGTHHAFPDRGEGFCVFNDAAVATRTLQSEGPVRRVLIIDCDVHQGNGTATIFSSDSDVTTLSLHGESNYPFQKQQSDFDYALPDGTGDAEYLAVLAFALDTIYRSKTFDLAIYISGADPFTKDKLGKLDLSKEGLAARDDLVFGAMRSTMTPVAVTMAGGYAAEIEDTVDIHLATIRAAMASWKMMIPANRMSVDDAITALKGSS